MDYSISLKPVCVCVHVCAAGGPGVGTAVKRPGSDDVHETSALQPPTTKKPAAPSAATERADKHVN